MSFLSSSEQYTLALICETFVPSLAAESGEDSRLLALSAADLNLADNLESALERLSDEGERSQIKLVLSLLEIGAVNGVAAGVWRGFSDLTTEERTRVLRAWGNSQIPAARQFFQTLKRLGLFLFYATMPDGAPNPAWGSFGYREPPPPPDTPRPIKPLDIHGPTTLTADVLVIGSGAGGGVVAGELTAAGYDVLVVEKGSYYAEPDFHGRELDSTEHYFEKYGSLTTDDLSMIVLAGNTLGGGTTINWSASLRPPEYVLREWARDYGFIGAESADFQHSLDAVTTRMNVNEVECAVNGNNAALARGAEALGYDVTSIPRNVKGCEECGFCNFGCMYGAKQGTLKTYLQDAYDGGARVMVRATVERVLHHRGVAYGALLRVEDENGESHEVTVKAKAVVVAAGSLNTPVLLQRSGLVNANIGANLHLHPVTVIYGRFDEPLNPWQGPPMTRYSKQFANLDGRGYGVRLETAPVHPGIAALSFAWQSGRQHKRLMSALDHMANIIILTRDSHGGRVTADKNGKPRLHYRLHPHDARHLMRGLQEALRIHVAAGAQEVSSPHNDPLVFRPGEDGDLETYLDAVARVASTRTPICCSAPTRCRRAGLGATVNSARLTPPAKPTKSTTCLWPMAASCRQPPVSTRW